MSGLLAVVTRTYRSKTISRQLVKYRAPSIVFRPLQRKHTHSVLFLCCCFNKDLKSLISFREILIAQTIRRVCHRRLTNILSLLCLRNNPPTTLDTSKDAFIWKQCRMHISSHLSKRLLHFDLNQFVRLEIRPCTRRSKLNEQQ